MKKLYLLLFFILPLFSFAQQTDEQRIRQVMQAQEEAWNRADLDGFMRYYWKSDSLMFVSKNGVKYGWQKVYDGYKKSYADKGEMGKLSFALLSVKAISADNYSVCGSWKVENKSGILSGYFTLWFKKINGDWFIVMDHTS